MIIILLIIILQALLFGEVVLFYIVIFIVLLVLLFVLFISLCNVPIIKNIRNHYSFINSLCRYCITNCYLYNSYLYVIAGGSKSVSSTHLLDLLMPTFSLKGLLYNNYGCGFTYLIWILIVCGLYKRNAFTIINYYNFYVLSFN